MSYFFSFYRSLYLYLRTVFRAISSNIDEVLSVNPSANVLNFGDFNQQTFVLMKTSFILVFRRRLDQDGYIRPSHTSSEDVFKKSSRRLGKTFWRFLQKSARHLAKMSSRHLQDVFNTYHQVKLFLLNSFQDVFETYSNVFQTYLFLFLFILFFSPLISIIQLYNQ